MVFPLMREKELNPFTSRMLIASGKNADHAMHGTTKQNFKEFLRRKLCDLPIEYINTECETSYLDGKQDFVEDLGNWAWQEAENEVRQALYNHRDWKLKELMPYLFGNWFKPIKDPVDVYWSIAVACLGEKEIKKRLKELEKK